MGESNLKVSTWRYVANEEERSQRLVPVLPILARASSWRHAVLSRHLHVCAVQSLHAHKGCQNAVEFIARNSRILTHTRVTFPVRA